MLRISHRTRACRTRAWGVDAKALCAPLRFCIMRFSTRDPRPTDRPALRNAPKPIQPWPQSSPPHVTITCQTRMCRHGQVIVRMHPAVLYHHRPDGDRGVGATPPPPKRTLTLLQATRGRDPYNVIGEFGPPPPRDARAPPGFGSQHPNQALQAWTHKRRPLPIASIVNARGAGPIPTRYGQRGRQRHCGAPTASDAYAPATQYIAHVESLRLTLTAVPWGVAPL